MSRPAPDDRFAHLTPAQRRAIRAVDRSVLVSAAAGSGKTTVLAERCAYLVCDLPSQERCRVDELLVVTFTDAAAGEMRMRIGEAIRQRLLEHPGDEYLREQLYLLDAASISTIHAFCKTLIQRWFPNAGVDPQATVLSAPEAALLRDETLEALFLDLYARDDGPAREFASLVDEYGAGNDRVVRETLLKLHEFLSTLPNPEGWLARAASQFDSGATDGVIANLDPIQHSRLLGEIERQMEQCLQFCQTIRACWPIAEMHAESISEHYRQLQRWRESLTGGECASWRTIAREIAEFEFETAERRPRNLSEEDKAAYDSARQLRSKIKELFQKRLQTNLCRFSAEEYEQGLARVRPHVEALCRLVIDFSNRYQQSKAAQSVLDFNDLQRCALRLLSDPRQPEQPSDVARQLQGQYRHVLIDEFQDVDPLQDAILRRVSRESAEPPRGNLFTVGDIKQSIYRFRLAEPALFAARSERFRTDPEAGELITLQENFRSRSEVIDAANLVFEPLMRREFGGSDYDDSARLKAAARYPSTAAGPMFTCPAVELHLLEPITEQTRVHDDEEGDEEEGSSPDEELAAIEREAYLIACRIKQWMGENPRKEHRHVAARPRSPDLPPETRPLKFSDIVILLRSFQNKAVPIMEVLRRMRIPARIAQQDTSIDSTEFRDCVSLLQILDNEQQDIPLAAVLRSPLLGRPFSESDLLRMRLVNRVVPFHSAVREYAERGDDESLRLRLRGTLGLIDRYRERIRKTPVAEVLWDIYQDNDYLAHVSGLPEGDCRRENLICLHEAARQFGRFSRQGLRRFLRFLEDMADRDRGLHEPGGVGGAEDVVRILTIHASKGLEFPVVIVADASKEFNLRDLRAPMLIDRELGIGPAAADPERRILYPTLLRQLAMERGQKEMLSEELRVWYVALTRAREHLLITGRAKAQDVRTCARQAGGMTRPTRLQLETAKTPLHWLLPALACAPAGAVHWHLEPTDELSGDSLFNVIFHDRASTDQWRLPSVVSPQTEPMLVRLAALEPLPPEEPRSDDAQTRSLIEKLAQPYPSLELTSLPARVAITDLKRRWESGLDPDERAGRGRTTREFARPAFVAEAPGAQAAQRGTATHRFLQLIDPARPCTLEDLIEQRDALAARGCLSAEDAKVVLLESVAWFFATPLGRMVGDPAMQVEREVPFVWRLAPDAYDPAVKARDSRDVLLVRGVADVILHTAEGLIVLDYKTDAVEPEACEIRAEDYRIQLKGYAGALSEIYGVPVARRCLVFLHPRRIIELPERP